MENFEVERINVLTRDTYYRAIHALRMGLPPPRAGNPTTLECRDNAAMAAVASLIPGNAEEVELAVLFIAASGHATDAMHADGEPAMAPEKRRTQAGSLIRLATGTRSLLLRVQAARLKREADNRAVDAAAWIEYNALNHMAAALGRPWAGPPEETTGVEPAADVPAADGPQSDFETECQISDTETSVRQTAEAVATDPAPPVSPPVSSKETISEISVNETLARRAAVQAAGDPPRSGPGAPPGMTSSRPEAPSGPFPIPREMAAGDRP